MSLRTPIRKPAGSALTQAQELELTVTGQRLTELDDFAWIYGADNDVSFSAGSMLFKDMSNLRGRWIETPTPSVGVHQYDVYGQTIQHNSVPGTELDIITGLAADHNGNPTASANSDAFVCPYDYDPVGPENLDYGLYLRDKTGFAGTNVTPINLSADLRMQHGGIGSQAQIFCILGAVEVDPFSSAIAGQHWNALLRRPVATTPANFKLGVGLMWDDGTLDNNDIHPWLLSGATGFMLYNNLHIIACGLEQVGSNTMRHFTCFKLGASAEEVSDDTINPKNAEIFSLHGSVFWRSTGPTVEGKMSMQVQPVPDNSDDDVGRSPISENFDLPVADMARCRLIVYCNASAGGAVGDLELINVGYGAIAATQV